MGTGTKLAATSVACAVCLVAARHGLAEPETLPMVVVEPADAAPTGLGADDASVDAGPAVEDAAAEPAAAPVDAGAPLARVAHRDASTPAPPPPSLPWSLRPPGVAHVVRFDTAFGFHEGGTDVGGTMLAMVKVAPALGVLARTGFGASMVPGDATGAFGNLILGFYSAPNVTPSLRLLLFLATSIPTGETDSPGGSTYRAQSAGATARGSMDGMIYSPNFAALSTGFGLVYLHPSGFSVQWEATAFALGVVRNRSHESEPSRFNLTTGLHVGYSTEWLSAGLELRYQHWISEVAAAVKDPTRVDALSVGLGIRAHLRPAKGVLLRPGVALFEPLDDPLLATSYHFLVFDVPCSF